MNFATRQEEQSAAPVASTVLVEACGKAIMVSLSRPLSLAEIWDIFSAPNRRRPICTLSKGLARVTF